MIDSVFDDNLTSKLYFHKTLANNSVRDYNPCKTILKWTTIYKNIKQELIY